MSISSRFNQEYYEAKRNKWLHYFAVFCRITLALGFIPSGFVKIMGERFASGLSARHPMGRYLQALYETDYYYTFIGISQLAIALLLLIPRTALLGALLYFPIILNIAVLAYAVRFEGTRITTLMVLANLYLLLWDYDRIKYILPSGQVKEDGYSAIKPLSKKFPLRFFGCVLAIIASVILINHFMYDIRPGNSLLECTNGCAENKDPKACLEFCDCVHTQGKLLDNCLIEYSKAKE